MIRTVGYILEGEAKRDLTQLKENLYPPTPPVLDAVLRLSFEYPLIGKFTLA